MERVKEGGGGIIGTCTCILPACNSLLPNCLETLATQAKCKVVLFSPHGTTPCIRQENRVLYS